MDRIAIIGAGMIGRAWAVVFARAGRSVRLYDSQTGATDAAMAAVAVAARDMAGIGLIDEAPEALAARVTSAATIAEALDGAGYIQENAPEDLALKRALHTELDATAAPDAIIGSSTSGFRTSTYAGHLNGRSRCLVAHPANPPSVLPLVELAPAPWTDPDVVGRTRELMISVGQEPIVVRKEIDGFILNRLQGALLSEAMRLIADGYVSTEDLDKTVKHGLGLRWSFMGPMETIDLNAPGGLPDYAARYGPIYYGAAKEAEARPWDEALFGQAAADRREALPMADHAERQAWRDRRLMALAAHKKEAAERIGN
jgi:3-hydroxyacyl-CoA dehydrogenase